MIKTMMERMEKRIDQKLSSQSMLNISIENKYLPLISFTSKNPFNGCGLTMALFKNVRSSLNLLLKYWFL